MILRKLLTTYETKNLNIYWLYHRLEISSRNKDEAKTRMLYFLLKPLLSDQLRQF